MAKDIPNTAALAGLTGNNVDLINKTTSYAETIASDSQLRTQIWSELVKRDARGKKRTKGIHRGRRKR